MWCSPHTVKVRPTDKCYNELPIMINNQSKFMSPVLQDYAEEVDYNGLMLRNKQIKDGTEPVPYHEENTPSIPDLVLLDLRLSNRNLLVVNLIKKFNFIGLSRNLSPTLIVERKLTMSRLRDNCTSLPSMKSHMLAWRNNFFSNKYLINKTTSLSITVYNFDNIVTRVL